MIMTPDAKKWELLHFKAISQDKNHRLFRETYSKDNEEFNSLFD